MNHAIQWSFKNSYNEMMNQMNTNGNWKWTKLVEPSVSGFIQNHQELWGQIKQSGKWQTRKWVVFARFVQFFSSFEHCRVYFPVIMFEVAVTLENYVRCTGLRQNCARIKNIQSYATLWDTSWIGNLILKMLQQSLSVKAAHLANSNQIDKFLSVRSGIVMVVARPTECEFSW